MNKIIASVQGLAPMTVIELFEIVLPSNEEICFHAGTNELVQPVIWGGKEYQPMPVQAEGFSLNGGGQLPRPKLSVANVQGVMSQLLRDGDEGVLGSKVTRRRTLAKYLDAVNFASGNPNADPTCEFAPDIFYVDRKAGETKMVVEFELAASIDLAGVMLPARQIIQNSCVWKYRGSECGYVGAAVATIHDAPTGDMGSDLCGKRLGSCKLRFGATNQLPYGGFPAAGLVRA